VPAQQWCKSRATADVLTLRPKRPGLLSRRYVATNLAAAGGFVGLPYVEELWRCYRADRTLAAHPATARAGQPGTRR
jgi:hypothetical protein